MTNFVLNTFLIPINLGSSGKICKEDNLGPGHVVIYGQEGGEKQLRQRTQGCEALSGGIPKESMENEVEGSLLCWG